MSENGDVYAVSVLKSWFEQNHDFFESQKAISKFKDSGLGSANVRLETALHLVDICVWDHASCLDIQLLELKSETSIFPHVGACETKSVFEDYLQQFIEWLKNERRDNT